MENKPKKLMKQLMALTVKTIYGRLTEVQEIVSKLPISFETYVALMENEVRDEFCVDVSFAFGKLKTHQPAKVKRDAVQFANTKINRDKRLFLPQPKKVATKEDANGQLPPLKDGACAVDATKS